MKIYIIGDAMDSYYNDIYAIGSTVEKANELIKEMKKRRENGENFPHELDFIEYEVDIIL